MKQESRKNKKIVVKKNEEKVIPFVWINPSASSGQVKEITVDVQLVEEGASVHLVGVFLGTAQSSITFNSLVVHLAKNTLSRTTIRGVFKDNASINNDALIRINKGAKGADGYFASKILLFDSAKGRSVPSLEIDENELKAGHASTVGRPDEEQLFYLRSRGLSEKEAEKLLIAGFFEPAIRLLPKKDQLRVQTKIEAAYEL